MARTAAKHSDGVGRVIRGGLLLYVSNGLPLPPDVSCAERTLVVVAVDVASMTDAGVEVAISRPLVLAVASIGAMVMVETATDADDDNDLLLSDVLVANVVLLATTTLCAGVLDVSTIRALVLTAAELTTIMLEPTIGVTLCTADDTALVAELAADVSLPALGQRSAVPLPERKAVMTFSPVTPALAQEVLTD